MAIVVSTKKHINIIIIIIIIIAVIMDLTIKNIIIQRNQRKTKQLWNKFQQRITSGRVLNIESGYLKRYVPNNIQQIIIKRMFILVYLLRCFYYVCIL